MILIAAALCADLFGNNAVLFQPVKSKLHCVCDIFVGVEISHRAFCSEIERKKVVIVFNESDCTLCCLQSLFTVLCRAYCFQGILCTRSCIVKDSSLLFHCEYPRYCLINSLDRYSSVINFFRNILYVLFHLCDIVGRLYGHRLKDNINACIYRKHSRIDYIKDACYRTHDHRIGNNYSVKSVVGAENIGYHLL